VSLVGYGLLVSANHYLLHINHLPWYLATVFVGSVITFDVLAGEKPALTAYLFAKRHLVAGVVIVIGLLAGSSFLFFARGTATGYPPVVLAQFVLEGTAVGVLIRMLFLAYTARLLKGAQIEIYRLLLLIALTIFLWLFPFTGSHRIYAGFYVYGCAIGFCLHYVVRNKEHRRAEKARYSRHITELLGSRPVTGVEVEVVKYYANQKWSALDKLLSDHEVQKSTVLAIVKASSERIRGEYDRARTTVDTAITRERDTTLLTFLNLQNALTLGDLNLNAEMWAALKEASGLNPQCALTLVTRGLRIAEGLPLRGEPRWEDPSHEDSRKEALACIWEALRQNEVTDPELISRIVGRTVPVNWTFLLDSYAYVLLKAGRDKFSRALLTECIAEDPYFAAPYLHLAEWCITDILKAQNASGELAEVLRVSVERSRRVAPLCLTIAIRLEGKKQSLTKRRAKELLEKYLDRFS
jgi:hypothetical protein